MIDFVAPYTFKQLRTTANYSGTANIHPLQFTVVHALGFSVCISRILATELQQAHCHFISHMNSSFHSLIHFLSLFCSAQFRRLNSIEAHILAGCTVPKLDSSLSTTVLCWRTLLYNHFARTPTENTVFYCPVLF
jgi:hypothetical protein